MRSSLPVSFLSLLLPTLAASAATPQCLNSKARALAGQAVCGDKDTLLKCFQKSLDASESVVEACLTKAGCTKKAATDEASYLFSFCQGEPDELKRREREGLAARDTASAASDASTGTTTTDASTTATTGTTAASKRQTTDTTATSTTAATTTAATTGTTTAAATTSNTDCSTASTTTVTECNASNQYDCSMVQTTTMVCRSNYYCDTDSSGNNLCMVRQDGMTTSGAIVGIFLAVCMTSIIGSVIFLCCRDRREQKRFRARAEAAAIAKENALPKPETTRSVSQRAPSGGAAEPNPFAG